MSKCGHVTGIGQSNKQIRRVSIKHLVDGLGGEQLIKRSVKHDFDLIEVAKDGLPMESVSFLQQNFGFTLR